MDDVLFQITKDHLDTGLRGFPVGYCTTSYVDAQKGLFYVDIPIEKLAHLQPQEVIYLLYFGKQGSPQQIEAFSEELEKRAVCSSETIQALQQLPRVGTAMRRFELSLLLLGAIEGVDSYEEDCLNLIAKLPHLVALVINQHAGLDETPLPKSNLGYMENFAQMLRLPIPPTQQLVDVLTLFNILHYDHGGGNLSTFVGKAVASGHEDLYGSIASAMCALAGPLHGKANQESLDFVQAIYRQVGNHLSAETVRSTVQKHLERGELIPGFGHAVLRIEDPRAMIFYQFAEKHYKNHPLVKTALLLREEASACLAQNPKISDPHPNVDAISGTLLMAAGFIYPEYFTLLFGLSRCVGIAIQIVYDRTKARGGKGTPIIRPRYLYKSREAEKP
jgi:citrate synthase